MSLVSEPTEIYQAFTEYNATKSRFLRTHLHENYLKNYQIKINSTWPITEIFTFTKTKNSSEAHIEPCQTSMIKLFYQNS